MISKMSVRELSGGIRSGRISAEEVTRESIKASKGDKLGAYITLNEEAAISLAKSIDKKIARGEHVGSLAGVPCAIKDNIMTEGIRTTCASKMLENYIPSYTATAVVRLLDEGAVIIGKTNMDEFAMGSTTETSYFGAVRNPHNQMRTAGGSSGGSAAVVSAGYVGFSLGSDTGGSIRQPAAYCGITGIKPTYGTVSRHGLVAYASSFDQIGPMGRDIRDAAMILDVISGRDPFDSTSYECKKGFLAACEDDITGMRIGIPREYLSEALFPEIRDSIMKVAEELEDMGAVVVDVSLPHAKYASGAYYIIACAQASSNLARYDGVKYGLRAEEYTGLHDMYKKSRSEGFGTEVKRRIAAGSFVLSSGYYEEYYLKALKVRTLIKQDFDRVWSQADVILTPVTLGTAPKIGEITDPIRMYHNDLYTVPANLAGLPAVSVPVGRDKSGMPIGLQIIGDRLSERKLMPVAAGIEAVRKAGVQ